MRARVTPAPDDDPYNLFPEATDSGAADRSALARLFTPFRTTALVLLASAALLLAHPDPDATLGAMLLLGILLGTCAAAAFWFYVVVRFGWNPTPAAVVILAAGGPLLTFGAVFLGEAAKAGVHRLLPQAPENTGGALLVAFLALIPLALERLLRGRSIIDLLDPDTAVPRRSPDTLRDLYPYLPPRDGHPAVLWPETPYLVLLQHATDHVAEAARILTGTRVPSQAVALMREQEWKTVRNVHRWRVDGTLRPMPGVSSAWLDRVSTLIRFGALADEAAHDPDTFAAVYLDEAAALLRTVRQERRVPHSDAPLGRPPAPVALAPEHDGSAPRPGHG